MQAKPTDKTTDSAHGDIFNPYDMFMLIRHDKMVWAGGTTPIEQVGDADFLRKLEQVHKQIRAEYGEDVRIPPVMMLNTIPNWRETVLRLADNSLSDEQLQALRMSSVYAPILAEKPSYLNNRLTLNYTVSQYMRFHYTAMVIPRPFNPEGEDGPMIGIGEPLWHRLSNDERLAVIGHEYGHVFENLNADKLQAMLGKRPDGDEVGLINECRADRFSPPEYRHHLIPVIERISRLDFDPEIQTALEQIKYRYPLASLTHPDPAHRATAIRNAEGLAGLSAVRDLVFDKECTQPEAPLPTPPKPAALPHQHL